MENSRELIEMILELVKESSPNETEEDKKHLEIFNSLNKDTLISKMEEEMKKLADSKGVNLDEELAKLNKPVSCKFVSIWENGQIETPAIYYPDTGKVEAEVVENLNVKSLDNQYIEFEDGETLDVCTCCNNYVMKTEMNSDPSHTYIENYVCSDPDCESNQ